MVEYHDDEVSRSWLRITARLDEPTPEDPPDTPPDRVGADKTLETLHRITGLPWRVGEPFILAPAMTAVAAAAAQALDLEGEPVDDQAAPCEYGIILLPEPIYERGRDGTVHSIGAITWASATTPQGLSWYFTGWVDRDDLLDPTADRLRTQPAAAPGLAARLGPYTFHAYTQLPAGRPYDEEPEPPRDAEDSDWESAPDGRYLLDATTMRMHPYAALGYAFWRIQAQPLATVSRPRVDRAARRRAARASIAHDTRVVMLRRTSAQGEPSADPKWHYRVRFVVRGHWRRLTDADGKPYRIWINAHLKGPEDAPLLAGDKIAILAR